MVDVDYIAEGGQWVRMCWDIRWRATTGWRTRCELIRCYICFNEIGLICGSTDLRINGVDVVVCGVCYDMNLDRVIEEVLG